MTNILAENNFIIIKLLTKHPPPLQRKRKEIKLIIKSKSFMKINLKKKKNPNEENITHYNFCFHSRNRTLTPPPPKKKYIRFVRYMYDIYFLLNDLQTRMLNGGLNLLMFMCFILQYLVPFVYF